MYSIYVMSIYPFGGLDAQLLFADDQLHRDLVDVEGLGRRRLRRGQHGPHGEREAIGLLLRLKIELSAPMFGRFSSKKPGKTDENLKKSGVLSRFRALPSFNSCHFSFADFSSLRGTHHSAMDPAYL